MYAKAGPYSFLMGSQGYSPPSRIVERNPSREVPEDTAKLQLELLIMLQNTHPQGTSIDEVLADARRVLERGSVGGMSSTATVRTRIEQLAWPGEGVELSVSRQSDPLTPAPARTADFTCIQPPEISGGDAGIGSEREENIGAAWKEKSVEERLDEELPNKEDLEPARNFLKRRTLTCSGHTWNDEIVADKALETLVQCRATETQTSWLKIEIKVCIHQDRRFNPLGQACLAFSSNGRYPSGR